MANEYQYKFSLNDGDAFAKELKEKDIDLIGPFKHSYTYFEPPLREKAAFMVLRLKESENERSLDLKIRDEKSLRWEKYESKIEDPQEIGKILESLGCHPIVTFKKTRKTYLNDFIRLDLDDIKDMGVFLEAKFKATDKVKAERFLGELGVNVAEHDKRSIIEIYLVRKQVKLNNDQNL